MNKIRKRILDNAPYTGEIGKIPPQAVELEEAVLGACLLEKEATEQVISLLVPESFYKEQNGRVWNAIATLYRKSEPIDILTVTQELKRTNELEVVGGAYYVSVLTNRIASSANIQEHARIVAQKQLARDMIRISTSAIKDAYEDGTDVFELYAQVEREMEEELGKVTKRDVTTVANAFADFIDDSIKVAESGKTSGIPTTYRAVDKLTNGLQPTDLIIIAGRPGMGKTAFALHCAYKAALEENIPVAFFSLEMSTPQLIARILASESELDLSDVSKKKLSLEQVRVMAGDNNRLFKCPFFIDDTPGLSLIDFKSKARRLVAKYGVKKIYIDYLQLMTSGGGDGNNRELEIATISRGLKTVAKELNIPIIALSQLNRKVEDRAGKKPQLNDLRESGAIEQDADMVLFCFRPEYYEEYRGEGCKYEYDGNQFATKNLFVGVVAKHRNGAVGEIFMGFINQFAKMTNWDLANDRAEWLPRTAPNLVNSDKSSTFVQTKQTPVSEPIAKLAENTGFLQDKPEGPLNSGPPF